MGSILFTVVIVLVAFEFFYIMYLETFATTSHKTAKVFNIHPEKLAEKEVKNLFKNQGIYNGLIGVGLLYGLVFQPDIIPVLLVYIILVAIYGAVTVHPKILLTQGGLAIVGLLLCAVSYGFN